MFLAEYDRWGYCDSKNDKEFWNNNSPKGIYILIAQSSTFLSIFCFKSVVDETTVFNCHKDHGGYVCEYIDTP